MRCSSRRSIPRSSCATRAPNIAAWRSTTSSWPSGSTTRAVAGSMRIADVVFDVPVPHPFSYRVPDDVAVTPGQRVRAPLRGGPRVGLVVAVRDGDESGLKALASIVDSAPVVSTAQLDLARWIAAQSLSTLGSTCAALLPPPGAAAPGAAARARATDAPHESATLARASDAAPPTLLIGHGRERRLLEQVSAARGPSLVLVPDLDAATRWAARLGKLGRVVRLDSGAEDDERADAWHALAEGRARLAVGTR